MIGIFSLALAILMGFADAVSASNTAFEGELETDDDPTDDNEPGIYDDADESTPHPSDDRKDDDGDDEETPGASGADAASDGEDNDFTDELIARAEEAGFNDEQAKAFGTPAMLEQAITAYERGLAALGRKKQEGSDGDGEVKNPASASDEPFKHGLDPELYDPSVLKALDAMAAHYESKMKGLGDQLQQILSAQEDRAQSEFEVRVEGMIDGLGKSFHDLLGKGSVSAGSEHAKNRLALIDEMTALAAGYKATGKAVPKEAELFSRALRSAFGENLSNLAKTELLNQARNRKGQYTHRPNRTRSNNGQKDKTPEQRAVHNVASRLNEILSESGDDDGGSIDD